MRMLVLYAVCADVCVFVRGATPSIRTIRRLTGGSPALDDVPRHSHLPSRVGRSRTEHAGSRPERRGSSGCVWWAVQSSFLGCSWPHKTPKICWCIQVFVYCQPCKYVGMILKLAFVSGMGDSHQPENTHRHFSTTGSYRCQSFWAAPKCWTDSPKFVRFDMLHSGKSLRRRGW